MRSPYSLRFSTKRNWMAACCFEQLGWSSGKSTTSRSRPISQQLRSLSSTISSKSSPLKTYIRQGSFAGGLRASGGSWYFKTIPCPSWVWIVLLSAASRPVLLKLGFSFSGGGASEVCVTSFENASDCEGRGPRRSNARGLGDRLGERDRRRGFLCLLEDRPSSRSRSSRCRWLRCLCLRRSSSAELVERSLRSRWPRPRSRRPLSPPDWLRGDRRLGLSRRELRLS